MTTSLSQLYKTVYIIALFIILLINYRSMETFRDLQPLTKVDPLFLYGLIYVCPRNDLEKLIPFTLPFLSITFIAKNLESYMFSVNKVCLAFIQCLIVASYNAIIILSVVLSSTLHVKLVSECVLYVDLPPPSSQITYQVEKQQQNLVII